MQARRWDLLLAAGTASGALPTATQRRVCTRTTRAIGACLKPPRSAQQQALHGLHLRVARAPEGTRVRTTTTPSRRDGSQRGGVPVVPRRAAREGALRGGAHPRARRPVAARALRDARPPRVDEHRGGRCEQGGRRARDVHGVRASGERLPAGAVGDFREDYRFTGKEEDVEVGLQYFGKRFYSPSFNRWASVDPLTAHLPGKGDLNGYAYVRGLPFRSCKCSTGLTDNAPAGGNELRRFADFIRTSYSFVQSMSVKNVVDVLLSTSEKAAMGGLRGSLHTGGSTREGPYGDTGFRPTSRSTR